MTGKVAATAAALLVRGRVRGLLFGERGGP